jgi:hypothetical protein
MAAKLANQGAAMPVKDSWPAWRKNERREFEVGEFMVCSAFLFLYQIFGTTHHKHDGLGHIAALVVVAAGRVCFVHHKHIDHVFQGGV